MESYRVIVFYRPPVMGRVKTRVAQRTGDEWALRLYRAMVGDLADNLRPLATQVLFYEAPCSASVRDAYTDLQGFEIRRQRGGDLGTRMYNALEEVLEHDAPRALLIGTDIPQISEKLLRSYLGLLDSCDTVLGPAADGGYYLIGCSGNGLSRRLFEDIPWSSGSVLSLTLERAKECGLEVGVGPRMRDIDTWDDLEELVQDTSFRKRAVKVCREYGLLKESLE
jgi:hypothetical protein